MDLPAGRTPASCPVCGGNLAALPGGLCPACLLALALNASEADSDADAAAVPASYRVLAVLAEEDDRTTYLGRDEDGRLVTLDVVSPQSVAITHAAFHRRLAALRALAHPAILSVLDGRPTADGGYCLVGRYVPGPPAATGAPPGWGVDDLVEVFDRICEAVAYAHDRAVTHGRLRACSVLLARRGDGVEPLLTGWDVAEAPDGPRADVRGLGRVLAALSSGMPRPSPLEPVVTFAATCPSVTALRAALPRRLRQGPPASLPTREPGGSRHT